MGQLDTIQLSPVIDANNNLISARIGIIGSPGIEIALTTIALKELHEGLETLMTTNDWKTYKEQYG